MLWDLNELTYVLCGIGQAETSRTILNYTDIPTVWQLSFDPCDPGFRSYRIIYSANLLCCCFRNGKCCQQFHLSQTSVWCLTSDCLTVWHYSSPPSSKFPLPRFCFLLFPLPSSVTVWKQVILLMTCQKAISRLTLDHNACVIHLTSFYHVGIVSSHIITRRKLCTIRCFERKTT